MKLSDIMSAAGLASFAEVALVIFLAVFAAVAFHVVSSKGRYSNVRLLPLSDGARSAHPSDGKE